MYVKLHYIGLSGTAFRIPREKFGKRSSVPQKERETDDECHKSTIEESVIQGIEIERLKQTSIRGVNLQV